LGSKHPGNNIIHLGGIVVLAYLVGENAASDGIDSVSHVNNNVNLNTNWTVS
jgi:hypothetical protein